MTIFLILLLVPVLVLILLLLNVLLASNQPDFEKMSVYECGFESLGGSRSQFSIAFYIVAILFLIFDLEIALFYPLGVCLTHVSIYGFLVAMIFIVILTVGFVYEYGSGVIKFRSSQDIANLGPQRGTMIKYLPSPLSPPRALILF
jgi:NADH-ubiquinone oxidoreductase chain 3